KVTEGDIVLGLASNGLHSNGFSLVRKIISDSVIGGEAETKIEAAVRDHIVNRARKAFDVPAPFETEKHGLSLGEALLVPTRIYVKSCLAAIRKHSGAVHALSHITGGGLLENIPRVLPDTLSAEIDTSTWKLPPVFAWLKDAGNISAKEMARTFNCGIGMVAIVASDKADEIKTVLENNGETVFVIGKIVNRIKGADGTILTGAEKSWG
ncbi:MAG: AIR synthase-related protein, partial [Rhodospirillaceae bacterium]|nr:AIR synthase-related protein [Rhodospirillaceae bacterium]